MQSEINRVVISMKSDVPLMCLRKNYNDGDRQDPLTTYAGSTCIWTKKQDTLNSCEERGRTMEVNRFQSYGNIRRLFGTVTEQEIVLKALVASGFPRQQPSSNDFTNDQ
jgi:hypothetical protein